MGRLVDTDDLVFVKDITERLGKGVTQFHEWAKRPDFPAPVTPPVRGRPSVYLWSEIIVWWRAWERTKSHGGRPRTTTVRVPRPKNPCPVKDCFRTRQVDARGNLRPFCRKHMKDLVWSPAAPPALSE